MKQLLRRVIFWMMGIRYTTQRDEIGRVWFSFAIDGDEVMGGMLSRYEEPPSIPIRTVLTLFKG